MSKGKKIAVIVGAVFIGLFIIGAIVGEPEQQNQNNQQTEQQSEQTQNVQQPESEKPQEQVASRCLDVKQETLATIESGAMEDSGAKIVRGKAVKSNDFENVYFVATEVQAPGIESPDNIAVFDTNDINNITIVNSSNAEARALFVWPDDNRTSVNDDGHKEAIDCLKQ